MNLLIFSLTSFTGHKLTLRNSLLKSNSINLASKINFNQTGFISKSLNPKLVNLNLFQKNNRLQSIYALARRGYCSEKTNKEPEETVEYDEKIPETKNENALSTLQVPEFWPQLPVIAINRNPIFPKFIRIIEITNPQLMNLIRRKVRLNQPYAGVFMKKDESNDNDIVTNINDLHPIGTFVQIHELQDLGIEVSAFYSFLFLIFYFFLNR